VLPGLPLIKRFGWRPDRVDNIGRTATMISMKILSIPSALLLCFLIAGHCSASAIESEIIDPPPILAITKLVIKPGKAAAVVKLETERAQLLRRMKWPRTSMVSISVTGPKQIWMFARYDTLGDLAKDQEYAEATPALKAELDRLDEAEGELVGSKRELTATYQPAISYRPKFDWSEVRYWEIIWVHLRTGHHDEYLENRRMTREEHEKGAYDTHQMMYAVQSGEPSGTFMVIRPMKTLALLDDLHAHDDGEPVTPQEEQKKVALWAESGLTEEEAYFRVDSKMSYLPSH
jgi:hypothetical protein